MANATHNQLLNALAIMLRPSHGCAGQGGIRFGAYMLAFCIFRYHRNSGPLSPARSIRLAWEAGCRGSARVSFDARTAWKTYGQSLPEPSAGQRYGLGLPAFVPHFPRRGRPEATPPEHPGLPSHRSRRTGVCLDRRAAVRTNSDESNSQQISIRRRQRRFGSRPSAPDEKKRRA